jgi:glycerophosphoryl diester phosphodiesterase
MLKTIRSLALIVLGLVFCLFFTQIYLHNKGVRETHPPLSSPFFSDVAPAEKAWVIAYRGDSAHFPENTLPAFDAAAAVDPNVILWADVRITSDLVPVIFHEGELASTTNGQGWLRMTHWSDIAKLDPGFQFQSTPGVFPFRAKGLQIPTLKNLLTRFPKTRFILNFMEYTPGLDEEIDTLLTQLKAGSRVIVQSEQDGFLRDMRARESMWVYGSSRAQITQFMMLLPFGLAPVAPLKADIYITDEHHKGLDLVDDDVINEVHRRGLKVFAGPVNSADAARRLRSQGVDGIISKDPASLRFLLNPP